MKNRIYKLLLFSTLAVFTLTSVNALFYLHLPSTPEAHCHSTADDHHHKDQDSGHNPDSCPVCQHFLYHYGNILTYEPVSAAALENQCVGIVEVHDTVYISNSISNKRSRSPPAIS